VSTVILEGTLKNILVKDAKNIQYMNLPKKNNFAVSIISCIRKNFKNVQV
jgi:hypothetical protein